MKKQIFILCLGIFCIVSCSKPDDNLPIDINYKQEMRDFVIDISQYAKSYRSNFLIIPQNGIELVSNNGNSAGSPNSAYLNAIDANAQEDLFYGYEGDDIPTPIDDTEYLNALLNISKSAGKTIMVTDYCSSPINIANSFAQNSTLGYISFAATERNLNVIPNYPNSVQGENNNVVSQISQAKNFLYLINPSEFDSKTAFINAITATNYDMLVMDLFFNDGTAFTAAEIAQLKLKANGGKRLVLCYMSIGEAENYRYYWQNKWLSNKPEWLDAENPNWEGNYKVKYWNKDWQKIIFGNDASYLKKVIDAQFDGVYLDIIDAFDYYENL